MLRLLILLHAATSLRSGVGKGRARALRGPLALGYELYLDAVACTLVARSRYRLSDLNTGDTVGS